MKKETLEELAEKMITVSLCKAGRLETMSEDHKNMLKGIITDAMEIGVVMGREEMSEEINSELKVIMKDVSES